MSEMLTIANGTLAVLRGGRARGTGAVATATDGWVDAVTTWAIHPTWTRGAVRPSKARQTSATCSICLPRITDRVGYTWCAGCVACTTWRPRVGSALLAEVATMPVRRKKWLDTCLLF
jgi:hypothetical protein